MHSLVYFFTVLSIPFFVFANPTKKNSATYPIECEAYENNGHNTVIISNVDGIYKNGGLKEVGVKVNGKSSAGAVSLVNGHDNNYRGTKAIDIRFANQLSIEATLSPAYRIEDNRFIVGEGPGTFLKFGQTQIGHAYCKIYSNCKEDSRVCPD